MKIVRIGEKGVISRMTDCVLYVRKDMTVAKASEWYYSFVTDNSYMPLSSLVLPEDGEILLQEVQNLSKPVELVTAISDGRDGVRNIYLRMENSELTEDGQPLYKIKFFDIRDVEKRNIQMESMLGKYRHFLSVNSEFCNEYYFEYTLEDNIISVYKYVNERAIQVFKGMLEEFEETMKPENGQTNEQREQMRAFCSYLRKGSPSFEMSFTIVSQDEQEKDSVCHVKGGVLYKDKGTVVGIMVPGRMYAQEAYYMTPAARDAGTGLLNKKAIMEYTVEKLQRHDGVVRWLVLVDIDDFKDINDTFGHMFGDQVIRKVADVLQSVVGYRGVVGRFGGDEFFMLVEKVPDRAALKVLLKTVSKELLYAFDPKLQVKASIGVSQCPANGTTYEDLFGVADKALYIAKEKGKNRHIIYDEKLHGTYQKDEMKAMIVAYSVSQEKRRGALVDLISNMYEKGSAYVTEMPDIQKLLCDLYDLDGITIYSDYGKKMVSRCGKYANEARDISDLMSDEKYIELFGSDNVLELTTVTKLKATHQEAYL